MVLMPQQIVKSAASTAEQRAYTSAFAPANDSADTSTHSSRRCNGQDRPTGRAHSVIPTIVAVAGHSTISILAIVGLPVICPRGIPSPAVAIASENFGGKSGKQEREREYCRNSFPHLLVLLQSIVLVRVG
jgi:hypothetical protein